MKRRAQSREAGFTLLELLISLAIVAILAAAEVAPFQRAISARDRAEETMERTGAARIVLQRLAEELRGAVPLSDGRFPFKVVDRSIGFPASELSFATNAARRIQSGPTDPIEIVDYRVEPPGPGQRGARLLRDQLPSVAADGVAPATAVMLENLAAFRARVLAAGGPNEWQPNWTGGTTGDAKALPIAVELELVLDDGTPEGAAYRLVVALPLGRPT